MGIASTPTQRPTPRHAVVLPALWRPRGYGEFHAVTVDLSSRGIRLRSAALPRADEDLTCEIRGVGSLQARVISIGSCDFVIRLMGGDPPPGEVARRLIALAQQQAGMGEAVRIHRRIVPRQTGVQVTLADGTAVPATILNLSASGVALQLDAALAIGQTVTVGRHRAVVARRLADGIGAAFAEALDESMVGVNTVL